MKSGKSDNNTMKTDIGKAVTGIMIIPVIAEGKSNQVIDLENILIIRGTNRQKTHTPHTHHTHIHIHTHTSTHR